MGAREVNLHALRHELYGLVDQLLARAFGETAGAGAGAPPPAPGPEPSRMKVGAFAEARGYSPKCITRWCALGMPHVGRGRARRILVAEADAWIAAGGPTTAARRAGRRAQTQAKGRELQ